MAKIRFAFRTITILGILFAPTVLRAQSTAASVSGFVNDASGAKLAGATVTFTNTDTGVSATGKTSGDGLYRIAGLLPGPYRSTVTMTGFKTAVREGIDLQVEAQATINYALDVGAVSESVTVDAATALIETQSPTVSQVIEGRQVLDTPLNGRNSMNLVALTPGVVPQGGTSGGTSNNVKGGSFTNTFGNNNYQIAGGIAGQASEYIDGTPLNVSLGHPLAFVIVQDAVQEFRVESSVVDPRYGEFGGGVISFVTKSGTAKLHGTFYEYLRNSIFNANNFFNNSTIVNGSPVPRPEFTQNQFGATIGGRIPHTHAFFFGSYEGFRLALGVPNVGRVPTLAERTGNFTADAPIFDPKTKVTVNGVVVKESQFACNGVANVICQPGTTGTQTNIDPTANYAANVINYFPLPNVTSSNPAINFSRNGKASSNNNQYTARVDGSLGSKQKLFARYTRAENAEPGTVWFANSSGGPTSGPGTNSTGQDISLGDTVVLNSTSVLDLRASYLRLIAALFNPSENVNLAGFGPFYAGIAPQIDYQEFPALDISGDNVISQPYSQLNPTGPSKTETYDLSGTYSKVLGRHSLSFGGEARRNEEYFNLTISSAGFFVFAGTGTACIPTGGPTTCQGLTGPIAPTLPGAGATPIADFVTGIVTVAPTGFTENAFPSAVNYYGGVFANDTFQISPRFTLTAGLRYELPGGFTEKHDKNTVLLPQLSNPLVLVNSAAYPSRSDLKTHLTLFSPRVGIAFEPYAGTSFRAGYSLAFLPADTVYQAGPDGSPLNSPTTFVTPGSPLSNPLVHSPSTSILQPIGRSYANTPNYFFGQTVASRIPNSRFPYMQQWNANLQQTLNSSSALQIAYLGARGDHLPLTTTTDINQLPDQDDSLGASLAQSVSPGVTLGQTLRPYPEYQNVNALSDYVGDAYYHSLQATYNKRFSTGGTLLANYSWSKFLSNAESTQSQVESHTQGAIQDFTNLRAEKSYLSFDAPQRLVVSYILDVPVGRGKHFLGNAGALVNDLAGGFNVSGINTFQSGFPEAITATANNFANLFGAGTIRPNVVAGCHKAITGNLVSRVQQGLPTINAACFTAPAAFGNEPRTDGQLRDQGIDNWDFSIGKTTPIHENVNLVFRAEVFNVINRVQFGDANLSSASSAFGVITSQANLPRLFQFSLRLNY